MKIRRMSALLLAMIMLITCLTGCGKTNDDSNTGSVNVDDGTGGVLSWDVGGSGSDSQQEGGNTARGRYVEEVTDLSDRLSGYANRIYKLSDGRLVITDKNLQILISDDKGITWKEDNREWHNRMTDEGIYIVDIAIGADNTAAVIYNDDSYDGDEAGYSFNAKLMVIRPDGTENLIDIPMTGDETYPMNVGIADNGRIFVNVLGSSNLYEVKEDGSCEFFMTVQGERPELMQFQGNLMFLDGVNYKCPLIYDMEKKEYVEDEVLADFISENYPEGNYYSGEESYQMYFFAGEEGVLYIAGKKGLHRHVIGGSAVEQLIDGNLCTFSNPAYAISGMVMLENNEFLTMFNNGRLVHYVYDPDVATVPSDRLKVYSLKDNDTVRQAISLYQATYPEIAVEYEIGMEDGSSATREDALKSLNTKIMAGEGPDVLILDNMPLDPYIEKGLLVDLSTLLGGLSGDDEIFTNIVQAMKKDDKVYAMPCEIQIPVIMGDEKYISGMNNLTGIADMAEKLREDNPGKDLFGIFSERGIMRYFAMVCAPAWTENGVLNEESIKEFLTQTKRIYDAQMKGASAEDVKQYKDVNVYWEKEYGELREESKYLRENIDAIMYTGGLKALLTGALAATTWYGYDSLHSVNKVAGFEDSKWSVLNGQSSNVFCAKTLLGISAASENTTAAEDFVKLCFGKESQSALFYGLAVNKAAFMESFTVDESWLSEDGGYSWESVSNEEGLSLEFITYKSDETQIAELRKCIEAASTPYIEDTVLEDAVYKAGAEYIAGNISLEEAVDEIEKKISIYMAE
ncbi:MAG: ABC transporter substrate-binding protein [Lachnospiraceae bacterium]|nr:ABC transporter substrate-binding protein [Lachnospiraceae bacterium]